MLAGPAHVDPVAAFGKHVAHALFRAQQAALLVDRHARSASCACVTSPLSGSSSPVSSLSSVVLPAPLAPTMPIRSPRWMRRLKSLDDRALAEATWLTFSATMTDLVLNSSSAASLQLGGAGRAEHRRALGAHLVELFQPALVALAPRGDAAFEPVRFDLELGVELLGGARFLGIDLLFPRLVAAEADFLAPQVAAVEPQRRAGQAPEEGAVVADDDEGALVAIQPALEPFDRREVEVVGRLVEQQQVGLLRQRAGKRGAAPSRRRCAVAAGRAMSMPSWPAMALDLVGLRRRVAAFRPPARNPSAWRSRRSRDPVRASRSCVPGLILRWPRSASIRPAMRLSSVVLPAPLRPISASRSRGPTCRSRPPVSGAPNSQPPPCCRPRPSQERIGGSAMTRAT